MNARTILIISVLALGLAPGVGAQQTHHGESFTLNSVLNPTQDHDYAAGWYIDLVPGFLSQPQEGNATDLRIDPYYNAPNEHGLLYNIPPDHDISGRLGFYPMDFRVNECGAATVSMPLEFPEGINGMTPHLSLEYNSQAGNGIMGLGWSLGGMSKISRVPYTYEYNDESHSVHFSGEDQLSLDGVILRKGTVNGAVCYYPEFYDYSVVYPVTEGFKVLKRNGLVYTYTSRYYLQQSITEPIEWHLSKVEDPDGNSIEYKYWNDRDEGAFLPTLIRYTCREGASPTYEIKFTYDTNDHRPDCPRKWFSQPEDNNFRTGFSRVTRNLEKIDCWHGTEKLVTYSFDYGTLDWNTKALAYVKKSFHNTPGRRDAVNAVVPVKFLWNPARHHLRYEQAGGPIDLETAYDSDHPWRQHTAFSARFGWDNMDHKQKYEHDIVHLMHDPVNNHYHLNVFRSNNNVGQQNQVYSYSPGAYRYDCGTVNQALADGRVIHAFMPADTDGDGLDEIVCVHTLAGNLKVSLIRPDSCVFHETVLLVNSQSNYDVSSFQTGDFNGDGLSDLLCFYSDKLLVRMSVQDTAFSKNAVSTFPMTGDRRVVSADFSGDLKDQIVVLRKTGNSTDSYFFRVTEAQDGTFSILPPKSISVDMVEWYYSNSCNRLCRGDFNGDGKQDILLLCSGAWRFYFSQGNGMFTEAQTMGDNTVVHDAFATSSEGNTVVQSFAVVADFDRDGCDDVSLTLLQDFVRPTGTPYLDINYKGAFRRDFLIRPTPEGIQVRRIRKTRGWWENGILQETDVCIDSIVTNAVAFSTWNVFLPVMGNHKGTSPCEILYCRMGNDPSHTNTCAFLHNTGNFHPDSLTRAITGIVNSLGATIEIHYTPVSYQHQRNENVYGKGDSGRSLTPVLPFNGSMDVVERVLSETKDKGAAQDTARTFRLTRYHFYGPRLHTRGKGFLGFETVWTRKQGQYQKHDIVTVMNQTLDQTRHILVPDTLTERHYRQSNTQFMDAHLQTIYTYAFQDNTAFAGALGQIPDGVFAPYLASSMTVRNDGSPVKYEKTATARDGYGNTTLSERSYGNSTSSFPYYEKTETTYDHSTSSSRWILGVPASETVTLNLTGVPADKVVRHTSWQNDMTHARHVNMVKESGSGKQLTETYGYDTFGHTSSVTSDIGDGSPRTETFSYTSDGRFMSSQTNAAGHTTQYHYDNATGLLDSITDPNGLTTRYRYDFLWDLVQTVYPSGVLEDRCMMWVDTCHLHVATWHPDTPGFGAPVYYTWCKRSGERESVSFYDQHRRKLREVGCTLDGRKVYVDYRYNDVTGLLTAVSAPYCPEIGETAQFTQYTYDHLDRSIRTDRADGAYASHSYSELTETFRSFDGQIRTLTHSRAGLVTKVSDYGDSNTSPVDIDYTYYGDGRVKSVKVGGDNATQAYYTYDVHRNPATVIDPALGRIEYDYNGFGELVRCITPRDDSHYGYDALGRMVSRTGYDGTSSWIYDVGFLGALWQTVYTPTAGHRVTEQFAYDRLGRMTGQTQTVGTQEEWAFEYSYDAIGRRNAITYPSGKKFKWHYDRNGFMDRVSDAADNTAVWQAEATDRWGNTTEFTEGNVGVNCVYDPVTGLPTAISARKGGQTLFGQACHWSTAGNLEWRTDTTLNLKETFTYDRFNRLLSAGTKNLAGTVTHATQGIQFDGKGNITQKDGVGGYVYGRDNPYAITALGPDNAVAGLLTAQTVTYTPFDKVGTVSQDGASLSVGYGIDRQRVTQTLNDGSSRRTKRYFTPLYETVTENGATKNLHYLTSCTGLFAIFVTQNGGGTMYYTLKDHQGSLAAVIQGNTVERLSYDPWGRRRNTSTFGYSNVSHTFDRGYTLHEHYDGFGLINMNGRLYDPILGRMLSPDIVIQDKQSSQAYNRYSYCFNNPLRFTDPSGYMVRGARDYYDWSSMTYYDFGRFKNKGSAFNTDLSEGKFSPIYDVNGYFLGTDDEGIQGDAIVMRREDFKQGMSHEDALAVATELDDNNEDAEIRFFTHYSQLSNRPDWDGIITDLEAREWWRNGDGRPLYVKQPAINLSPLSTKSFDGKSSITHNFFFDINSDKDIGRVYGTLTLHLINPNTGEVKLGNINTAYIDTYDFNPGGSVLRNMATWGARILVGDGTPFNIYGWGDNPKVKVKLKWKQ